MFAAARRAAADWARILRRHLDNANAVNECLQPDLCPVPPDDFYPMTRNRLTKAIRAEWFLGVSLAMCLVFACLDPVQQEPADIVHLLVLFSSLFAVVLGTALAVARHADHLAVRLGEPYGTMILTLSVTTVEVVTITAVMLQRRQ
jgi:hypothetical protein